MKDFTQYHHRRSIRLQGYDYSQEGLYFITICTHEKERRFGSVQDHKMILNPYGMIADSQWQLLPNRFPNIDIGPFIIMPNHIHGIIIVRATLAVAHDSPNPHDAVRATLAVAHDSPNPHDAVRATLAVAHDARDPRATATNEQGATARVAPTIGRIVGAYKSLVVHYCMKYIDENNTGITMGKMWQRNFYEHIIRDERSYERISRYIKNNPGKWID